MAIKKTATKLVAKKLVKVFGGSETAPAQAQTPKPIPTPVKTETRPEPTKTTQPEIIRDDKGHVTGVSLPDGRTFLGVGRDEALGLAENFLKKQQVPAGAIEAEVGAEARRKQAETLQQQETGLGLASQVGQLSPEILDQVQRGKIEIGQVLGGGLAAATPGVAGGVVAGAAGGALVGGVGAIPGAVGGAVIGGVGAFVAGARSNLKSQKQGLVQAGAGSLMDGEKNLRKFVTAANKDPANAAEYMTMFNEQLSYIARDEGILKLDTKGFLKDISGVDGTPQIADYERFNIITRPFLEQQMQMALLNPDPNKNLITAEEALE